MKRITRIIVATGLSVVLALSLVSPCINITVSAEENLPAQFDQRSQGIVTPVKMQNPWGTCWAFAAASAMETSILSLLGLTYDDTVGEGNRGKEGAGLDLSEKHLTWFSFKTITANEDDKQIGEGISVTGEEEDYTNLYNAGADNRFFSTLLASGVGPIYEYYFPYKGRQGFTKYEYYLNNRDECIESERQSLEKELGGLTVEDFIEKLRSEGKLSSFVESAKNNGWIDPSVTVDTITAQILLEGITDKEYKECEDSDVYSEKDDWTVDELGEDGYPNRFRTCGFSLKDGNMLPQFANRDDNRHWTGINEEGTIALKKELLNGHGVLAHFEADTSRPGQIATNNYLNLDTWAHYTYEDKPSNHVIAIVGWDDNYSKDNFNEEHRPPGDGAWIAKNSWGSETDYVINEDGRPIGNENWGVVDENGKHTGYFYISYYDKSLLDAESIVLSTSLDRDDGFYAMQYDYLTSDYKYDVSRTEELKTANIFTFEDGLDAEIQSVSTKTANENAHVKFQIYLLDEDSTDPTDGTLVKELSEDFDYKGYHRVDLDEPIYITYGQRLAVVATETNTDKEGNNVYEMSVNAMNDYDSAIKEGIKFYGKSVVNPGESFIYTDGKWQDWSDIKYDFTKEELPDDVDDMEVDNFSVKVFLVSATLFDNNTSMPNNDDATQKTVKVKPPKTEDGLLRILDIIFNYMMKNNYCIEM